ncbi:Hypp5108 [Branchiostoma lanceolatum]|uniref:Hypp5108 protein n=1 Tax=Branchiostoma lanceolatum TaxID=7740 RepID=A0A8K0F344_BRALA|nr:Hypp5108 [Branchiostoma lanceolatum]
MNLRSGKSVDSVLDREQKKRKANRARPTAAESRCEEQQLLLQVVVAMAVIFIGLVLYVEWNNLWFGRTNAQDVQKSALASKPGHPSPYHLTLPSRGSTADDYALVMEALLEHHPHSVRPFVEAIGKDLLREVAIKLAQKDVHLLELMSEAMDLPPDSQGQCSFRVRPEYGELEVICEGDPNTETVNNQEL